MDKDTFTKKVCEFGVQLILMPYKNYIVELIKMFSYLVEMLECPQCHGDLKWVLKKKQGRHIIDASVKCVCCNTQYYIRDGIGNFLLTGNTNDNWKEGEDFFTTYFSEYPEVAELLMNTPVDNMNAADLNVRAELLRLQGRIEEAKYISEKAASKTYTPEYTHGMDNQLDYIVNYLKQGTSPVVDIASGRCTLVEKLLERTNRDIVATDFSLRVLEQDNEKLSAKGYNDKVSFIAFDAKHTPFKTESIKVLTTFVGLQNIDNPGNLLSELKRITSGEFLSVSIFYPEDDLANVEALKQLGLETTSIRSKSEEAYNMAGWNISIENSYHARVLPTPRGEIIKGAGIDAIPVAETTFEWCTVRAR